MRKTTLMGQVHFDIQTGMKKYLQREKKLSQVHQSDKYFTFAMMFMRLL